MALTKISKSDLNGYKVELEKIKETGLNATPDIIETTNKSLMELFNAPKKYAEKNITDDLNEVKNILEERKWRLENPKSIKRDLDINKFYGHINKPTATLANITPAEKTTIKTKAEKLYKKNEVSTYIKLLPDFVDFWGKIRKDPTYKITDIEAAKKAEDSQIVDIAKALKGKNHFKWTKLSNEMELKLTRLIILFSQLDQFDEIGTKKNQLDEANRILDKIDLTCKQLQAHQSTKNTINLIDTRIKNIEKLETTKPINLGTDVPGKFWISSIPYPLKNHFLNPSKGLIEAPEWYNMRWLKFKDKSGNPVAIFQDITGTKPFNKDLNTWQNADIFFKDGTVIKKFANIEITNTHSPALVLNIESYMDLPSPIFPINFDCTITGIGGNTKDVNNKVGITKQINGKLDKPDFGWEYDEIELAHKINEKLDKIYDETYEAKLKYRLDIFMRESHLTQGKRGHMTSDEKNHFFEDIIKNNVKPARLPQNIYDMIIDVTQTNCYKKDEFQKDFKDRILNIFSGKTKQELKILIEEKLGTLDFTELNSTYAIKLLGDKIEEKYNKHQDGLHEALNVYMNSVRGWGMKVTPEKLRHGELAAVKEIKAVVADSKEISREDAYKNALKQIEDQYKSWVKFWYTRAKIFFFREKMMKNLITKELKGKWGITIDDKTNSAVNRRAAEKSMGGSFAENIIDVEKETSEKVFDDPIFQQELDVTVFKYINGSTTDDVAFQSEIEELINGNAELRAYMKRNNITHLGTNIIQQAKAEKAERSYYGETIQIINDYITNGISNKPQEYEIKIRAALEKFMKEQNKLPDMVKSLWLNIDKIDFATTLAQHRTTLETMKQRTVKMRLSLLVNKSEDKKGLTTAQYVNRDKFDVTHMTKFTKWMEKHPRWSTGMTALWLVGTWVVGALTMPVIGVAGGASILWYLNFLKKKGHYTQEHKKFEETILAMTPIQREKYLEDLKENSEKRPAFIRRAFPTKYTKYGKSMEYFQHVDSVDSSTKKIQKYLQKSGPLAPIEKQAFQRNLIDAITLLQAHKEKGRNFMYGKEGNTKIEEMYNELYKIILAWVTRYDPLAKNPETVIAKIISKVKISKNVFDTMDDYDTDYKKMRKMRARLWVMAGTKSAAIYIGSAYAAGRIKNQVVDGWNYVFGNNDTVITNTAGTHTAATNITTNTVPTIPWGSSLVLDPAFGPNGKDLLNSPIFDGDVNKFNTFVAKIQTIPEGSHSEKLWSIFRDMYGTDQLANAKTHDFFNLFSSQITDMPASAQQELIKLGTNVNLHSTTQISNLMTSRWYNGMVTNQTDIGNLISRFQADPINHTLNNLPTWWTKETACNVLFCNAQGNQLTDLIFDKVSILPGPIPTPIPGPIPGPTPTPIDRPRYNNFLSFWAPTVWNEVNKFNKEQNT